MSEYACFRFMSYNMLTPEEQHHKDEIVALTEKVLDSRGLECDSKISKISEEQIREILGGVRRLQKRNKKNDKERGEDQQKEELDIAAVK